jgi:predicted metal-binding membrane protein
MMIGMMTPSVAPMVLLYVAVGRNSVGAGGAFAPASAFLGGYLLSWTAFSAAATLLQWLLESLALITPMMAGTGRVLAGGALIVAGIYQWLPIKQSCLSQCRAPPSFVQRHGGFQASVAVRCDSVCCTARTASAAAGRSWSCCSPSAS